MIIARGEFTRPADTTGYIAGDLVGNATSGAVPLTIYNCAKGFGRSGYIVRASLITDLKSITPTFRVHVFNSAPTQSQDNQPYRALYADVSKRVGEFTLGPMATPADATNSTLSRAVDVNLRVPFVCAYDSADLMVLFETLSAFTPASGQKFTLQLAIDQD